MIENDNMTPAQREIVEKAWETLTEHFDRVLLVVDFDTEEEGGSKNCHHGFWHGGSLAAIGAAEFAKHQVLESGEKSLEP